MMKACGYCGRIHPMGMECPKKPKREYESKTKEDALRNTYRWAKKREQIKEQAHWLCEVCVDKGIINPHEKLEVHHIEKLRAHPELLIDDTNLVCLCVTHHKQADAGQLTKTYLKQLATKRINKIN